MASECPFEECDGRIVVVPFRNGLHGYACDEGDHPSSAILYKLMDSLSLIDPGDATDEMLRRCDPVEWVRDKVREAQIESEQKFIERQITTMIDDLPTYPTGFIGQERGMLLNLRGMTTISGRASSGKSWFALGAGLNAAKENWHVHYLAAEAPDVIHRRVQYVYGEKPPPKFKLHSVEPGVTLEELTTRIEGWIYSEHTLLIIDSITTLMAMMSLAQGVNKWDQQERFAIYLHRMCELTKGSVSILNTSESNAAGEVKGRVLDYKSNISINIESIDDSDCKKVYVKKSWEGPTGLVGNARIDRNALGLSLIYDGPVAYAAEDTF